MSPSEARQNSGKHDVYALVTLVRQFDPINIEVIERRRYLILEALLISGVEHSQAVRRDRLSWVAASPEYRVIGGLPCPTKIDHHCFAAARWHRRMTENVRWAAIAQHNIDVMLCDRDTFLTHDDAEEPCRCASMLGQIEG